MMSDVERQTDDSGDGRNCSSCNGGGVGGGGGGGDAGDASGCISSSCRRPDAKVPTADPEPPPQPAVVGGSSKPEAVAGASKTMDAVLDDPSAIVSPTCFCGGGDGCLCCCGDDVAVCCNAPPWCACPAFVPMPSSNSENQEISEEEARKRRIKYTICLISLILGIATVNLLLLLGLRFFSSM